MPTAAEVVRDYLDRKQSTAAVEQRREVISTITSDVVSELPDTFSIKDVRACVYAVADDDPEGKELTPAKRGRIVSKTLNDMVARGVLTIDEAGSQYTKQAF